MVRLNKRDIPGITKAAPVGVLGVVDAVDLVEMIDRYSHAKQLIA